jgi:hypothetical protein
MLFKLLQNLRFFREAEIRERLRSMHRSIAQNLPEFVQRRRQDLRHDIIVTYLDGPGKSGAEYANLYAEENRIWNGAVLEMGNFSRQLQQYEQKNALSASAVVIVDDILGSGKELGRGIKAFCERNGPAILERKIPIVVVVLTAHSNGLARLFREVGALAELNVDVRVCEQLSPNHVAFEQSPGIWKDETEFDQARSLVTSLGRRINGSTPLGFANQGLLVVFPKTCPNNSLPILHSDAPGQTSWRHLFRRPRN